MTIYNGMKYALDRYKDFLSPDHTTPESKKAHDYMAQIGYQTFPDWALQLKWPGGPQVLPDPHKEITFNEYMLLGPCGFESEGARIYEGLNVPGETQWFGGNGCQIQFHHTYGLVVMHRYASLGIEKDLKEVGLGQIIPRGDGYGCFIVRYFRIGCEHRWVALPEESRMCYHVSRCSQCGMKQAIDSSD